MSPKTCWILGIIVDAIFFGVLTAHLSNEKGRGWKSGFWYGFFLSILGLVYVAMLPMTYEEEAARKMAIDRIIAEQNKSSLSKAQQNSSAAPSSTGEWANRLPCEYGDGELIKCSKCNCVQKKTNAVCSCCRARFE